MATEIHMLGCECGCDCCEPLPETPQQERDTLLRQKALIEERLQQLERV